MHMYPILLQVITDADGKVVATKPSVSPEPSMERQAFSLLVPGQYQRRHQVEVEVPEHLITSGNATELHELVQTKLDQTSSRNA